MSQRVTKSADNRYYKARIRAAEYNAPDMLIIICFGRRSVCGVLSCLLYSVWTVIVSRLTGGACVFLSVVRFRKRYPFVPWNHFIHDSQSFSCFVLCFRLPYSMSLNVCCRIYRAPRVFLYNLFILFSGCSPSDTH